MEESKIINEEVTVVEEEKIVETPVAEEPVAEEAAAEQPQEEKAPEESSEEPAAEEPTAEVLPSPMRTLRRLRMTLLTKSKHLLQKETSAVFAFAKTTQSS